MTQEELISLAKTIAAQHSLDPVLVCSVCEQESTWNPWAIRYEPTFLKTYVAPLYVAGKISATELYTRSMSWGLMQVMGETARELGFVQQNLPELCDPHVGIEFGCRKLAHCLRLGKGDVAKTLSEYNGGSNLNYAAEVLARQDKYR